MYQRSVGGWDLDLESVTRWPSLVSKATDLRVTVRSLVLEVAGESGVIHYHGV